MIQICKPAKASRSLEKNPERAILMPKFIMAFTADSVTQVRFLHFHPDVVRSLVDDDEFPETLAASFAEIIDIIEEVS